MRKYSKRWLYVFTVVFAFSTAAFGAPQPQHAIPTPSQSSDPLFALPRCQKGERTISPESLNDKLESLQPGVASDKAPQFAEDILSFQQAIPNLLTGSCLAIESDAKPSVTQVDAVFRDYLSRTAMITWKYESGVFEFLKKNGARSRISCRLGDKPKEGLPAPSGAIKPVWEYCCTVELCVDTLKF